MDLCQSTRRISNVDSGTEVKGGKITWSWDGNFLSWEKQHLTKQHRKNFSDGSQVPPRSSSCDDFQTFVSLQYFYTVSTALAKLVSQVSGPSQYNLSFHGLPFVRDKSTLWGVIMRSTFNMASDHLHSHHVSENCQVFKLSLIKWGSARCHSRDRNRVLISKENSISLPPLFLRSASRHVGYEGIFVDLFVFSTIRAELGRLSAKLRYKFVFS